MAVAFSGTLRALQADRLPWKLAGLTSLLVLPAALAWMIFAEITLYEVSSSARLEVQGAPSSVATEVEGRVVLTNLQVGLQTAPGDILMVLDGEAVQRAMEERRQHITALRSRRTALSVEIEAAVQALESLAKARGLAFQEAEAQLVAAVARSQYARQSLERSLILSRQKAVAEDELEKKRAEADSAAALVQAAQLTITRGEQDRLADEKQRQAELARLRREAVELDGDVAVDEATIKRLEYDLERRTVRANVAGRVEEVVPIRVGAVARRARNWAPSCRRVIRELSPLFRLSPSDESTPASPHDCGWMAFRGRNTARLRRPSRAWAAKPARARFASTWQ